MFEGVREEKGCDCARVRGLLIFLGCAFDLSLPSFTVEEVLALILILRVAIDSNPPEEAGNPESLIIDSTDGDSVVAFLIMESFCLSLSLIEGEAGCV